MFVEIDGFISILDKELSPSDRFIPFKNPYPYFEDEYEYLLSKLEDGDWTYLEIRDGNAIEIVRLENICEVLILDRGQEGTKPLAFKCGSIITFALTEQGVKDLICQMEDKDCEETEMKYKSAAGFISNLTAKLGDNDKDLPVFEEHLGILKSKLGSNGYSFLEIFDGTQLEIVKVSIVSGSLFLERGMEETNPQTFPVGSCVKWVLTPQAVRDIICQMECCP